MVTSTRKLTGRLTICAAVLAVAVSGLVAPPASAAALPPDQDSFYVPPPDLASAAAGEVLRSRAVQTAVWGQVPLKVDTWQVLYRTNDTFGQPQAGVATIIVPRKPAPPGGRKLLAYQMAEDSLGRKCDPSYQLQQGAEVTNPVEQIELLAIGGALDQGWTVVVPDHQGPNAAYAAGVQAGHHVLDSIRATEGFAQSEVAGAGTEVGMWGYSGGAIATGWASELQADYAPELNVKGVAQGGVASDVGNLLRKINRGPFAGYALGGMVGVSRAYPELAGLLDRILTAEGKAKVDQIKDMCNGDIVLSGLFQDLFKLTTVADPIAEPDAQQVIAAERRGQHRPAAPQYIYEAVNDEIMPLEDVDALAAKYCAQGVPVNYQRDLASEHITLAATGAPAALTWLIDRLGGKPEPSGCTTETKLATALDPAALTTLFKYLAGLKDFFF
ncbi:lipase family protein [Amycolatopsis nigrescens]|uniref:lipase family protein n=1 Tax=Amycolatopsis nigrescens TaxID=381445 RepID=UPI00037166F9|nr:lipase family protein [Amycolatopsis nigrescens]